MTDEQIVCGIKDGDEGTVCFAIDKYSKLMWHIADIVLKNIASAQDIEECVADVFVYLWQNADKFDRQRGTLKAWLSTVVRSKAIDRFRKLSKARETEIDDEMIAKNMNIVENIVNEETRREILAAINALSDFEREIVLRRYYYQQKVSEISFALECPKKQVENKLYRTKQKLREALIFQD